MNIFTNADTKMTILTRKKLIIYILIRLTTSQNDTYRLAAAVLNV